MTRHRRPPSSGRTTIAVGCAMVALLGAGTLLWVSSHSNDPDSSRAGGAQASLHSSPAAGAGSSTGDRESMHSQREVLTARGEVLTARGEVLTARGGVGQVDWVAVLERLDDARAAAFAAGRPEALGRVYATGSPVLREDQRLLAAYAQRGLVVTGLRARISDLRVLAYDEDEAVLLVVDRVAGAVRDAEGRTRPLPEDRRSGHRIELVRGVAASAHDPGGWRIASIRPLG